MSKSISGPPRSFIKLFDARSEEINTFISNQKSIQEKILSRDGDICILISGNFELVSLELSDGFFTKEKKDIEDNILHTVNLAFKYIINKTRDGINKINLMELLNNVPKEIQMQISQFQTEFANHLIILGKQRGSFHSEDNNINIEASGGLNILLIDISSHLLLISKREELESQLLLLINKIINKFQKDSLLIFEDCKNIVFNNKNSI